MTNVLLYGQPGSGKSTLAKCLVSNGVIIDGDELRKHSGNFDYTQKGREDNINLAITIASFLDRWNISFVMALVAPYKHLRERIKQRLPDIKAIHLYYDKKTVTRGREKYWAEDFENDESDFSVDTGLPVIECLDLIYNYYDKRTSSFSDAKAHGTD